MAVLTTFPADISAVDARDTLNAILARLGTLEGAGSGITLALSAAQSSAEGTTQTYTVTRTGNMNIDVLVDFITAGTGSNPLNAADHSGGVFPSGRKTIAASASTITIPIVSAQDATVEPDETGLLTISSPTANVTISKASSVYTFTNDDTSAPAITTVYGPADGAADSGDVNIQSTLQQLGRTWRSGAPKWKVVLGQSSADNFATGLFIRFDDDLGSLTYAPQVNRGNGAGIDLAYTGAAPSATEPYTYVISDATSIRYYCATSSSGANARLLATIPASIWDDVTFWGSQIAADRVPGKYAQANAHSAVANGIYAARLGAIQ